MSSTMKWISMKIINSVHLHLINPFIINACTQCRTICENTKVLFYVSALHFSSHYDVLDVSKNASNTTIKKAYYAKCKKLHPDVGVQNKEVEQEFRKVQAAYEILKSRESRRQYDVYLNSLCSSQHDFQEWKVYNMQSTKSRDFEQYNTIPKASKGLDAEWSDFTFKDVMLISTVFLVILYIIITELKKERNFFQWRSYRNDPYKFHHYEPLANALALKSKTDIANSKETQVTLENSHYKTKFQNNHPSTSIKKKVKSKNKAKKQNAKEAIVTPIPYNPNFSNVISDANITDAISQNSIVKIKVVLPKQSNLTTWKET